MMKIKFLVAITCYNCEKQLPRVIESFSASLLDKIDKILIIDNRSPDNTLAVAKAQAQKISPKFQVVQNNQNYGLGGSHKVAFSYALENGYDYIGILHGDNQAKTEELELLIAQSLKDPSLDAVLGARFMKASKLQGYSKLRTYGNKGLNWVYSLFTFRRIYDLGSGINLFKTEIFKDRKFLSFSDQFTFNMDLILYYVSHKAKLCFYPITWSETDQISNAKTFKVGWITLKTILQWRFLTPQNALPPKTYSFEIKT